MPARVSVVTFRESAVLENVVGVTFPGRNPGMNDRVGQLGAHAVGPVSVVCSFHAVRVYHVESRRDPSRHTAHGPRPIAPSPHSTEEKTSRRLPHAILRRRARENWL